MKRLFADCRHAVRLYAHTPGASAIAVLVLAISMAFVGAFLSLYVDQVLRPHPGFNRGGRIATIGESDGTNLEGVSYSFVDRIADEMPSIEAAANPRLERLIVGADGELANTVMVTKGFFPGLQPRLALGRGFREEDHLPDAEPVVVLSYAYWQQRFGGDRNVLGNFLEIGHVPGNRYEKMNSPFGFRLGGDPNAKPPQETAQFRIVGVMSEGLSELPAHGGSYEPVVWLPLERVWPMFLGEAEVLPLTIPFATYVRRAPGVSASALANELRARYGSENADWNPDPGFRPDAIDGIVFDLANQREARRQLALFLAGSVLLALVAATNVSLFLLARAPRRRRELGIRLAVGAPMRRLARQLATEAGLLVLFSTALGLVGSVWLSLFLRGLPSIRAADWHDVTLLDWRVLTLAAALLLVLSVAVSLAVPTNNSSGLILLPFSQKPI